jgi:phosphate transport system protein
MRELFDRQIAELRREMISIYASIDLELHDAVDALVEGDKDRAKACKKATRVIDARCNALEDAAYNLIVTQSPVASDLRMIQFLIYVNFNLLRMSNHVRNIAKTTKRCAGRNVPGHLLDLLASEAHLVYRVLGATVQAMVENDLAAAAQLPEMDQPVDDMYKNFYSTFAKLGPEDDIDAASRVMMAARMLERISDNSVEAGERLVFLLTGNRTPLDDLTDLDEDEIEELYASQGAAFSLGNGRLERIAEKIPEVAFACSGAAHKGEAPTAGGSSGAPESN